MATKSPRKRAVTFDATAAFQDLVDQVAALSFRLTVSERRYDDLQRAHRALKDGYIKHVHESHLVIEARLAAAEWVAADVCIGPDVDPAREWE